MRAVCVLESKAIIQKAATAFKKELDRRCLFVLDSSCRTILDKKREGMGMEPYKLGEMERRLAEMLWERAPLRTRTSSRPAPRPLPGSARRPTRCSRACASGGCLRWRRARCARWSPGRSSRPRQGEQFVNENFAGSLPRFLAAFVQRKKLTETEIDEIERLIRDHKEE